jgi:hypothetical protein
MDVRETYATRIMEGMHRATVENQRNAGRADHFAHAVSAHGVGTNQIPRLLTGRRADQVEEEDAAGTTPVARHNLTGNAALPDQDIADYTRTGTDLSDISSAFTSNTAMMFAVEDALSNAWARDEMMGRGELPDADRIAYTSQVNRGPGFMAEGAGTGFNIPRDAGVPRLRRDRELNRHGTANGMSEAEVMDARYAAIETHEQLPSARVILDRAEGGGFDVQTAFPTAGPGDWESRTESGEDARRQRIRDERARRRAENERAGDRVRFGNLFS